MTTTIATTNQLDQLAALWRDYAEHEAGPYSPLYAAIARAVADDRALLALTTEAPPANHLPIALLAAVHYLVLGGTDHPLADAYAAGRDEAPRQFRDFCLTHRDAVLAVLADRRIQTNECGRSAVLALALDAVTARHGLPAALVDAGASAGLNLLYDRYHLDYGDRSLGDPASAVHITCEVGPAHIPLPTAAPSIAVRIGLDRHPLDVTDDDDRRWLLACVWPDTGRLERTAAALAIAATDPPDVRQGDMVDGLGPVIDGAGDGLVCVVTSWALAYLPRRERRRFADVLREAATRRPVVWLSAEAPGVVDLFDPPTDPRTFETAPSVVGIAAFDRGRETAGAVALAHPHGKALEWL